MVLLRFAPSPTGALHLGGLRTALFNHLYARKLGGKWILRVEDTDVTRYVPGSVEGITEALAWAGLDYDYGPVKGGPHGPYFQSERLDLYRTYAEKLVDSGHAYRCFCSPDKLAMTREKLARTGSNATYDKSCLNLTDEEVARRLKAGEKHVIRMNDSVAPTRITPDDIVFGSLKDTHASLPTDPVVLKSDLFPTYHLASVVDDHEMGITHIVRGEEWLPSLALHLDLYASLGITPPRFAHLPLLLNPDGSKMSKRKGDVDVMEFMKRGWEPGAVLNWLALAGWGATHVHADASTSSAKAAPTSTTVMTVQEMIQEFDLSALTHRKTILDPSRLERLNKDHLMETWSRPDGLNALANRAIGPVREAFPDSEFTTTDHLKRVILALQGRTTNILGIAKLAPYFFVEPDYTSREAEAMVKSIPQADIVKILTNVVPRLELMESWTEDDLTVVLHEAAQELGISQKTFMTVLRHALSGMKTGPGVTEIMGVLGKERSVARLRGREIVS